jgi:hypothetical protein
MDMYKVSIILGVIFGIIVLYQVDNNHDIEMAKAGLQQCVVRTGSFQVVWQKECEKAK